ncbi:MAG: MBL fold metallo-hydrolase [Chloroflexota bacterium]|nr:MBL fold metallo-hydrolase [Chloroflexota bacterium]
MKLTTIGGSAAGTGTLQGCSCYLVQSDTTSVVLDLGPGTLQQLRSHVDYRLIDGIVISHLHADHIADLVALRFTLSYNPVPAPAPVPLWLPPDGIATLRRIAQAFESPDSGLEWFTDVLEVQEFDPNGSVEIGDLTCTFTPTVHYVPCWAIRVHPADGTSDVFYTADTGPAADLASFGSGAKVVIAEATDVGESDQDFEARGHLTAVEAAQLASDIGAETLVLAHMFEERDPEGLMIAAEHVFDGTLLRAVPGLEVRWRS